MASALRNGTHVGQLSQSTQLPEAFNFDEGKMKAADSVEKQELFLFQWLATLERELKTISEDVVKKAQPNIEKLLMRFISLPIPKPHRPVRRLIGQCFVLLYERGDTRTLFDTLTTLHALINATKNVEKESKLAAVVIVGAIMGTVGHKMLSLFAETLLSFLKILKSSSTPQILRLETINSSTALLKGAGKAANESALKDLIKHLKSGLGDKASIIRVASAECMEACFKYTTQAMSVHDIEQLLALLYKTFESSVFAVRRAVAHLCATLLALTQTMTPMVSAKTTSKKTNSLTSDSPADPSTDNIGGMVPENALMITEEMLLQLSREYNRAVTNRELRAGIVESYAALFIQLGTKYIEANYTTIVRHLMTELVSNPRNTVTEFDVATVREHVAFLLHDVIGRRLLSEHGQAVAVRTLMTGWAKEWPALMPTQTAPSQYALVVAVNEVSALLWELGGAASSTQDVLVEPLITLLSHPNFPVQVAAAWCLRCLCISLPANLAHLLPNVFGLLEKDVSNLTLPVINNDLHKRVVGYAHGVAAMMSVIPSRSLYISFDVSARAFSLANQLLKNLSKDIKISAIQTQIAWILIGSLMCLGPNFVKLHLPNLLLLWKTTLPKPMVKDTNAIKSDIEWSFAFHTREAAITSIYSFLKHNARQLVNVDIAKRIVALLNNTLAFLTAAPSASFASATAPVLTSANDVNASCLPFAVTMADQNSQLRRRIFECFIAIRPANVYESLYPSLLRSAVSVFADPEKISQVLPTGPAAATYVSVWQAGDGYGYGISSKINGYHIEVAKNAEDREDENNRTKDWMAKDRFRKVESQLEKAVLGSPDRDPLMVYTTFAVGSSTSSYHLPQPVSALTSYIDTSIELFATLFPLQTPPVQESILEQIIRLIKDPKLEKNSGRKMAIQVNVTIALLGAMKNVMASTAKKTDGLNSTIAGGRVAQMIQDILQEGIIHPDQYVRFAASDSMGRLTSIIGSSLIASQIKHLVDQVVSNRDPDARAGSALALGSIYSHVGGMAASAHLKNIVGILLSLSSDPHPVVYSWALNALATTVGSAGLTFSSYVSSTLSLVAKLYMAETHEPGGGSSATSNAGMAVGFSPYQEFGKIVYELIGTLGPELQSSSRTRELCLSIVEELKSEPDERVNVGAIRCIQNFIMFAPQHVDMSLLVPFLQSQLASTHLPLKRAAATCLYQLVQRDVKMVFRCARPGLNEELFALLDTDPHLYDVRDVIKSWLKQTAVENPSTWVNICKTVMSRTNSDELGAVSGGNNDEGDFDADYDGDEFDDEQLNIPQVPKSTGFDGMLSGTMIPPRWRTQLFAMQCLHQAIEIIANSNVKEHFDLVAARRKHHEGGGDYLVLKVADLIRLGFSAATAPLNEMRLEGITLLRDVIEKFASTEDPDFADSALLEQYAAQIGAALTPAFAIDSSSEIVSAAVKVCAIYVGSGIVKELDQLGRVLRLLTAALDKCKDESNVTALGEVRDISPHASVMVKLAVLNAWAELQVSSTKQEYLIQVIQPNLPVLSPLWLSSLREYARVRLDSDIVSLANGLGMDGIQARTGGGFESMYSASTKDVILPFYKRSWLKIMGAVATLIEADDEYILRAVHEHEGGDFQDGPSDLFYILFGLCIETLSKVSSSGSAGSDKSPLIICLGALKTFMRPSLAGNMFLSKGVFLELMNVFDRLVQTEGPQIQIVIVETISRLVEDYGPEYICDDLDVDGELNDFAAVDRALDTNDFPSTAKLYYMLRLLVIIFLQIIPALSVRPLSTSSRPIGSHTIYLLSVSLDTLASMIAIGPSAYKSDLLAIALYVYTAILQDDRMQSELAPRVLVNLKTIMENSETSLQEKDIAALARVLNATTASLLVDRKHSDSIDSTEIRFSKMKNALLATVLIFSGCPAASLKAMGGLDKFVDVMQQALIKDNNLMCMISLQCARTLFLLPSKRSNFQDAVELGRLMIKALCPLIVNYILSIKMAERNLLAGDPEKATVEEAIKTLALMVGVVDEPAKPILLGVLLSTLTFLLDDSSPDTVMVLHNLAISQILQLATSLPGVFREVVASLPQKTREKLQAAVRQSVEVQQQQQKQEEMRFHKEEYERTQKEPTIQLNFNFSNFA